MEKAREGENNALMRIYPNVLSGIFHPRDFKNIDVRNRLFTHYRNSNLLTQYKTLRRNNNYRRNKNLIVRLILKDGTGTYGEVEDNHYTGLIRGKYRQGLKIKGAKAPIDYQDINEAYLLRKK